MKSIYLDNAATTPLDPQVQEAISLCFSKYGNASSTHHLGQEAAIALDQARAQVADLLVCDFSEVIFTSGATESNNLILKGMVEQFQKDHQKRGHMIVSAIEHPSVLEVAKYLESKVDVTYIYPQSDGVILADDVIQAITEETFLISIMYVNNEVGTIQPIRDIGKQIEKINKERVVPILFHSDATQATNYLNMDVRHLHVHALSFSSHKIYGPKGIGALYVSKKYKISPQLHGGSQEWGMRPGTSHTLGLAGFAKALELLKVSEHEKEIQRIEVLRNTLQEKLIQEIPSLKINGSLTQRTPGHLHVTFPQIKAETLYVSLDMQKMAVSLGAACAAGKVNDSHVLKSMGIEKEQREGSIRLSLGRLTTSEEVQKAGEMITECYQKLK